MPISFCFSKRLQFGVCKASSAKCQMPALHSQTGVGVGVGSKLWGQKCSIILQQATLGAEVSSCHARAQLRGSAAEAEISWDECAQRLKHSIMPRHLFQSSLNSQNYFQN